MKKELSILAAILGIIFSIGIVSGVISSYDSITGKAVVEKSIVLDIMGSSNDENYTLSDVNQGETKWSPKIKIDNKADVSLNVSLSVLILPNSAGNSSDVSVSFWNEDKNQTVENPILVNENFYFYVKHEFSPNATPGDYYFGIYANP
jgi:hypothetical protein